MADASASAVTTFESLRLGKTGNLTTSVRCIGQAGENERILILS